MMPEDPLVGGTILRRPAIASPDYLAGVSGWSVNADGSAEFNNMTVRGIFSGADFLITTAGLFFYGS